MTFKCAFMDQPDDPSEINRLVIGVIDVEKARNYIYDGLKDEPHLLIVRMLEDLIHNEGREGMAAAEPFFAEQKKFLASRKQPPQ